MPWIQTMEGSYDPPAPPYMESPMNYQSVTTAEQMHVLHPYTYPDQFEPYCGGEFVGAEHIPFPSPPLHNDQRRTRSPPYGESYAESFGQSDVSCRLPASPEAPSIEKGNQLLCFQPSVSNYALLDYSSRQVSISMSAQLHGMFFLAESSRSGMVESFNQPAELTCYRRNLFQITGSVATPRMMQYILTERGERVPIVAQELVISARESGEGSPVKIISVPWKTPASSTAPSPEEKTEKEPAPIPLDMVSNQDMDTDYAIVPFAWKRLQFRVATANNGRRPELQQHFIIKLSIHATLQNGNKISLCDILSGPIIVRGRSPRNFHGRRDVPLSLAGGSTRKALNSPPLHRMPSADSRRQSLQSKLESNTEAAVSRSGSEAHCHDHSSIGSLDWQSTPICSERNLSTPSPSDGPLSLPLSPYARSNPEVSYQRRTSLKRKESTSASPVSVSRPTPQVLSSTPERPRKLLRTRTFNTITSTTPSTLPSDPNRGFSLASPLPDPLFHPSSVPRGSHGEPNDILHYGYPPLGLEDWLPPVHGMYPQHMAHPGMQPPMTAVGGVATGGDRSYLSGD